MLSWLCPESGANQWIGSTTGADPLISHFLFFLPTGLFFSCERKVAQMVAVFVHAHRGTVALAGAFPTQLQRVLRFGFLRWGLLPAANTMVIAARDTCGNRPLPQSLLFAPRL